MSDNKQSSSTPVLTEWYAFIFCSKNVSALMIYGGVDQSGKIWLQTTNLREAIFFESFAALNVDKFDKLVSKLPEALQRTIPLYSAEMQGGYSIPVITPAGLHRVILQLLKSPSVQVIKAANRVWAWLTRAVMPQLREIADKYHGAQAEVLPHEDLPDLDLPDEELDIAERPPFITEWHKFIFRGKRTGTWALSAGIDKSGKIWLSSDDISTIILIETLVEVDKDEFNEFASKLPETMLREIQVPLPDSPMYDTVTGITPSGLFEVTEQILKDSLLEQANEVISRVWNWLESDVFLRLREIAANHRQKANIQEVK